MGFSAYAMAVLHDGRVKRCEDLAAGDALRNQLSPLPLIVKKVWNEPGVGVVRIRAGGDTLDLSGDERLSTGHGPTEAGRIHPGTLLSTTGGHLPCEEASTLAGDFMLYSLSCPGPAVVTINGFLVHIGRA